MWRSRTIRMDSKTGDRPVELCGAECEDPAVGRVEPVPTMVLGGDDADDRPLRVRLPVEPKNGALKLKIPPSDPTSQYPCVVGVLGLVTTAAGVVTSTGADWAECVPTALKASTVYDSVVEGATVESV